MHPLVRQLGQLVLDAWTVLAEEQRRRTRYPAVMMRRVIEYGPGNLVREADVEASGIEWGYCAGYVVEAVKVAAWSPQLAARIAAGKLSMNEAIEAEREHRLGPWNVRHPECPLPLPGPDDPDV